MITLDVGAMTTVMGCSSCGQRWAYGTTDRALVWSLAAQHQAACDPGNRQAGDLATLNARRSTGL